MNWMIKEVPMTALPITCCEWTIIGRELTQRDWIIDETRSCLLSACLKCQTVYVTPVETQHGMAGAAIKAIKAVRVTGR